MPPFAKIHMVLVHLSIVHIDLNLGQNMAHMASKAQNLLVYPHTSSFGTYVYCISSHTDNNKFSPSGWVMK
jgi:hypothetical protein